jgi:hypothetical protein
MAKFTWALQIATKTDQNWLSPALHIFKESARMNSIKRGIHSAMIEVMMRDSKDNNVLYRQIYGTAKDKGDPPFSVNNITKRSSVFTDLTFKDINTTMQITVKKTV